MRRQICPSCKSEVAVTIRDNVTRREVCYNCIDEYPDVCATFDVRCGFTGRDGSSFRWTFHIEAGNDREAIKDGMELFISGLTSDHREDALKTISISARPVNDEPEFSDADFLKACGIAF